MNKYAKLSAAAVVASLGTLALAPTATADTTLTLFEHDTVQYQADLGRPGPCPGDQFIFAGDLFDRPGGMFLGTTSGSCTTLTGNDKSGQTACNGTFNLAGGQIVTQGVVDTAAVFVRGDAVPLSIVGGTEIYQNARGNGTVQVPPDVPNETDANFVLYLTGG
ncbi:MAG: hypothetical protein QOK45_2196 [Mycobacterium sp.]|jgi:hypothetical protein|nr:hypothetical protein [Mycobacterium sp.]